MINQSFPSAIGQALAPLSDHNPGLVNPIPFILPPTHTIRPQPTQQRLLLYSIFPTRLASLILNHFLPLHYTFSYVPFFFYQPPTIEPQQSPKSPILECLQPNKKERYVHAHAARTHPRLCIMLLIFDIFA